MSSLIEKVLLKDAEACKALYNLYAKPMFNVCLRLVNNEHDANDVLQDSFVCIFQNLGQLKDKDLLSAWIKRICVNTSLQFINQKKKLHFESIEADPILYLINEEEELIDEMEFSGDMIAIREAIQKLPERYRLVFIMHAIEDYSHEEIAKILEIAASTSRSQYLRSKQKLIQILKKSKTDVRPIEKIYSEKQG